MKIITHPANLELIRQKFPRDSSIDSLVSWIEIKTNASMEYDKPSGRYIMPDGSIVARDDVLIRRQFVTYGPEDIYLLLWIGLIREEREPLFYQIDDSVWSFRSFMNYPVVIEPRGILINGGW